jgi:hypothetical protein
MKQDYNSVEVTSLETDEVADRPLVDFALVGTPSISGQAIVGQTLTASIGTWDAGASFSYRWLADEIVVPGATASTLVITEALLGAVVEVEVTATKAGHNSQIVVSAPTAIVVAPAAVVLDLSLTPTPEVDGSPIVGEYLIAELGEWDLGVNLSYAWHRNGSPITGATGLGYLLTQFDVMSEITFVVTATKAGYNSVTKTSDAYGPVVSAEPEFEIPTLQVQAGLAAPVLQGVAQVGSVLTTDVGLSVQSVVVFEYQWLRNGVALFGATSSTYEPKVSDLGSMLSLRVTSKRDGYLDASVTSAEVGPVREAQTLGGGGGFFLPVAAPVLPITSNPIPIGQSIGAVDADGKVIDIKSALALDKKSIDLTFGSVKLSLSAPSGASFSADGKLSVAAGSSMSISATGYQPDSKVSGFLVPRSSLVTAGFRIASDPVVNLGTATVSQDGRFTFDAKLQAVAGSYLLQLTGTTLEGKQVTIALETVVAGAQSTKTWAKRLAGNTQAKLYAKNIIGQGKVSLRVNGKEIAWARAVDETDPKLRVVSDGPMAGSNYLVRTIKLAKGKNVLEVWVDGKRTTRTVYSRK